MASNAPHNDQQLRRFLAAAPDVYPRHLEEQYPRVFNNIASAWAHPRRAHEVFDELLVDRRGTRRGFPPEVASEIFRLSVAYEKLRQETPKPKKVWQDEEVEPSIEELGMRRTPADMLRAAENGNAALLRAFIRAGMHVDTRDARDWTPLMVASFHGNEEAAKVLLECGANPRARDRAGYTPLHWAALKGYREVVALLARSVDCNVQSNFGLTPLLQAAARGHTEVVRVLLEAGADPNIATRDGWTPLHKAIANDHADLVPLLLKHGASVNARHVDGTTPVTLAWKSHRQDIVKMLTALGHPA